MGVGILPANRSILRLAARRAGYAGLSMLVVATLVFWAIEALPGDAAQRILGREATPQTLAVLREKLHLGDPAIVRYGRWLGGLATGDLGRSLASDRPVLPTVAHRLGNTLVLALAALAVHVPSSLLLGLLSATARRNGPLDTAIGVVLLLSMSVPEYVIAILLVAVFSTTLHLVPPLALIDQATGPLALIVLLALPVATLTMVMTAYVVRQTRASVIEVLRSDFVRAAILRGLPRWRVLLVHALPSALGPTINAIALNAGWLVGGIVVIEAVFSFPGLGTLLVEAVGNHDVPLIQGAAMALALVYVAINLAADVAVVLINPKLRAGGS